MVTLLSSLASEPPANTEYPSTEHDSHQEQNQPPNSASPPRQDDFEHTDTEVILQLKPTSRLLTGFLLTKILSPYGNILQMSVLLTVLIRLLFSRGLRW